MPGSEVTEQYAREGFAGYDPELAGTYDYDPEKAKSLLAEAGHPDGIDLGDMLISQAIVPARPTSSRSNSQSGDPDSADRRRPADDRLTVMEGRNARC